MKGTTGSWLLMDTAAIIHTVEHTFLRTHGGLSMSTKSIFYNNRVNVVHEAVHQILRTESLRRDSLLSTEWHT